MEYSITIWEINSGNLFGNKKNNTMYKDILASFPINVFMSQINVLWKDLTFFKFTKSMICTFTLWLYIREDGLSSGVWTQILLQLLHKKINKAQHKYLVDGAKKIKYGRGKPWSWSRSDCERISRLPVSRLVSLYNEWEKDHTHIWLLNLGP